MRSYQPPPQMSSNLFVAGLLPAVDDHALEKMFNVYGNVLSAKVMVDLHTAKSRRFGFVLFQHVSDATAAQAALNDRATDLGRLSVQFSNAHSTTHLVQKSDSLYVRNIPKSTPAQAIRIHFETFGQVLSVEVLRDTAPGATGQYAVAKIVFADPNQAAAAERATQCSTNCFAIYAPHAVPPLLAKMAEKPAERARRMELRKTTAPLPPDRSAASVERHDVSPPQLIIDPAPPVTAVWFPIMNSNGAPTFILLPITGYTA